MPWAPPRVCGRPGCRHLIGGGPGKPKECPVHGKAGTWADKARGQSHQRGYGWPWRRLRASIVRERVLCEECLAATPQRVTPGTELHHRVGRARGGTDDPANLVLLCADCHRVHTLRQAAEGREG
jgi:5-methylcytosine-specific restriction protein A